MLTHEYFCPASMGGPLAECYGDEAGCKVEPTKPSERTLREVAAKREILDACVSMEDAALDGAWWIDQQDTILRALASVYADHPSFQDTHPQ